MSSTRTPIGGLLLEAAEGWSFSLRDGVVAGRRGKQPGVLHLISLAPNQIAPPLAHERVLQVAMQRFGITAGKATDVQMIESATGPFGSATFRQGKDVRTVWYCTRPAGFILGCLSCPAGLAKTPEFRFTRIQCHRMIGSALFNRAEWGGDDALSKFVATEILEQPPPAPPAADEDDASHGASTKDAAEEPPKRPSHRKGDR
jgi:hypothetical protein